MTGKKSAVIGKAIYGGPGAVEDTVASPGTMISRNLQAGRFFPPYRKGKVSIWAKP